MIHRNRMKSSRPPTVLCCPVDKPLGGVIISARWVRLEIPIVSLNPELRQRCVAPDI
jgi:hypothetical protein